METDYLIFLLVLKVPPCLDHYESFLHRKERALFPLCLLLYFRAVFCSARLAPNAVLWYPSSVAGMSTVEPGQSSDWEDFIHGILCSRTLCAVFQLQHLKVHFLVALGYLCWLQLWHSSPNIFPPTVASQMAVRAVFWPTVLRQGNCSQGPLWSIIKLPICTTSALTR